MRRGKKEGRGIQAEGTMCIRAGGRGFSTSKNLYFLHDHCTEASEGGIERLARMWAGHDQVHSGGDSSGGPAVFVKVHKKPDIKLKTNI